MVSFLNGFDFFLANGQPLLVVVLQLLHVLFDEMLVSGQRAEVIFLPLNV